MSTIRKRTFISLVAATVPLVLWSVPGSQAAGWAPNVLPDADRAAELTYMVQQDCGACHGMRLNGGLGPALRPENLRGKPPAWLRTIITHGNPNRGMPGWKTQLAPAEINWIAEGLLQGRFLPETEPGR